LKVPVAQAAELMNWLLTRDLVRSEGQVFVLTPAGKEYALRVIRAHRLWEQYLAEETGYSEVEWHGQAEEKEHRLTPEEASALDRQLGHPLYDPHGDPIPDRSGEYKPHAGHPLTGMAEGRRLRIVHIEDEPETIYTQLVAEGLSPGMEIWLAEVTPQRVRFWEGDNEHLLAPLAAANISVLPVEVEGDLGNDLETGGLDQGGMPLSGLKIGERGVVLSISARLRGVERRRMLDLGILPGTDIRAEMASPSGNPTAYRVRGALIALREEQARLITVNPIIEGQLQ
jgi:DtxR family Mn-dependent transcriptional regulator